MYGTTTDYGSPTVEKAPTLMEALRDVQSRMLDLEVRVVDLETRNDEYGVFGQYFGGHVERDYEPELDDTIDESDEVI